MRSVRSLILALLFVPTPLLADQVAGTNKPKLADLPEQSYTLQGIVDDAEAAPFACSFGHFVVKIQERRSDRLAVTLSGSGILLNSGWLHTKVSPNPKTTYLFPLSAPLTDGSVIAGFCNGSGKPGEANIDYYVPARAGTAK